MGDQIERRGVSLLTFYSVIVDVTAVKIKILAAVGQITILPDAGVVLVPEDLGWCPGLSLEDTADLPAAQDFPGEIVLSTEYRYLVKEFDDHNVASAEIGCI